MLSASVARSLARQFDTVRRAAHDPVQDHDVRGVDGVGSIEDVDDPEARLLLDTALARELKRVGLPGGDQLDDLALDGACRQELAPDRAQPSADLEHAGGVDACVPRGLEQLELELVEAAPPVAREGAPGHPWLEHLLARTGPAAARHPLTSPRRARAPRS